MQALAETETAKAPVVILAETETQGVDRGPGRRCPQLEEYDRHPGLHRLVRSGYEVGTF
jgi:hypothetical protein